MPEETHQKQPDSSEDCLIGAIFDDRYVIEAELGTGGMGKVFRARDTSLDRFVALKVMHWHFARSPSELRRFHNEARLLTTLDHPAIVRTYSMGVWNDFPFMVMDLVEGISLEQWIKEKRRLDLDSFHCVFRDVLNGLEHAHKRGVIHRDIKSSNILIDSCNREPQGKIVDFGIAKLLEPPNKTSMELTQTGQLLGSPYYMSPEQSSGAAVDHRTDIYSICCVMYESLTGTLPFMGDNPLEVLYKQVHDTAPDLVTTQGVPLKLAQTIHQGMQKHPDERFQTAADLAAAIEEAIKGKVLVHKGNLHKRRKKAQRSLKRKFPVLAILAIAAFGTAIVASFHITQNNLEQQEQARHKERRLKLSDRTARQIFREYSSTTTTPEKFEELADLSLQTDTPDFATAVEAYSQAAKLYKDRRAAVRCCRNGWSVVERWLPFHHHKEAHRYLSIMASVASQNNDFELVWKMLNEWRRQEHDSKDAVDTRALCESLMTYQLAVEKKREEALKMSQASYDTAQAAPSASEYRFEAFLNLARAGVKLKDKSLMRRAAEAMDEQLSRFPDVTGRVPHYIELCKVFHELNETEKEEKHLRTLLSITKDPALRALSLRMLGIIYADRGKLDMAATCLRDSFDVVRKIPTRSPSSIGFSAQILGDVLLRQNKLSDAKQIFMLALDNYKKEMPANDGYGNLAACYRCLATIAARERDVETEKHWTRLAEDAQKLRQEKQP